MRYGFTPDDVVPSGDFDARWVDDASVSGVPALTFTLPETAEAGDDLGRFTFAFPDHPNAADDYDIVALVARWLDDVNAADTEVVIDVDPLAVWGDSWISEDNPGDNHGADTLLQTSAGIIAVQDQNRALLKWDLTSLADWVEVAADDDVEFTAYYDTPLLETPFTMGIFGLHQAADPWTEGTVTWNNRPAHNTQLATIDFPALAGDGERTVTLSWDVAEILGDWLSLETRMVGLLEVGVFSIAAREHATFNPGRLRFTARLVL